MLRFRASERAAQHNIGEKIVKQGFGFGRGDACGARQLFGVGAIRGTGNRFPALFN